MKYVKSLHDMSFMTNKSAITKGKIYEVTSENVVVYMIKDDSNAIDWWSKSYFEEYNYRNEKLDRIL